MLLALAGVAVSAAVKTMAARRTVVVVFDGAMAGMVGGDDGSGLTRECALVVVAVVVTVWWR